jgi:NADH-quinone oxidoreductase subunit I
VQARQSRQPIGVSNKNYFEQKTGIVTLQYPKQQLPVPDNARYQLHNEIDDCIVCDKCAKVCPVDCIDIEPIKSPEVFGTTSDGTAKRLYAAKFDIDMAKCCFCGLCTTVCPTECLTMTKDFDFSSFDIDQHTFEFANLSITEIAQKRQEWDEHQANKVAAKPASASAKAKPNTARPVRKPATDPQEMARQLMEKKKAAKEGSDSTEPVQTKPSPAKPVFKPKVKAKTVVSSKEDAGENSGSGAAQPKFRPKIKPKVEKVQESEDSTDKPLTNSSVGENKDSKPKFRPKIKPVVKKKAEEPKAEESKATQPKPRPVVKPKVVPRSPAQPNKSEEDKKQEEDLRPGDGGAERE